MCFCLSGLSLEQVDILWHCLVEDAECYDDALHWFLNQVRSKDQHAMGMETYKHLFLEKVGMRTGNTESYRMYISSNFRIYSLLLGYTSARSPASCERDI